MNVLCTEVTDANLGQPHCIGQPLLPQLSSICLFFSSPTYSKCIFLQSSRYLHSSPTLMSEMSETSVLVFTFLASHPFTLVCQCRQSSSTVGPYLHAVLGFVFVFCNCAMCVSCQSVMWAQTYIVGEIPKPG